MHDLRNCLYLELFFFECQQMTTRRQRNINLTHVDYWYFIFISFTFNRLEIMWLWSFPYPLFIQSFIHLFVCLLELWTLRFRIVRLHWVKHVLRSKAQIKKNLLTPSPMVFPPTYRAFVQTVQKHAMSSKRKVNKYYPNYTSKYVPY